MATNTASGTSDGGGAGAVVSLGELEDQLCTLAGRIAAATAEFLRLLGEFDEREGWAGPGLRSCAPWLSWRCAMALPTARDHVRVARRLRGLPVTRRTFAERRLSYSKVRAICRVATPATEPQLVEVGLHSTAAQVERMTRCLETAAPDQVPSDPPRRERPEHRLRWEWQDDGTLRVSGRLTAEDGAAFLALLEATAEARRATAADLRAAAEPADDEARPDPLDQPDAPDVPALRSVRSGSLAAVLVGDASRAGASRAGAAGLATMQGAHGPVAEVVVHIDADLITRLRDEAERQLARGHLEGGPALALATIERLACDGNVRLASHGSDGRTLDLGRRRRRPTGRQLRALVRRDGGCAAPGCGRVRFLHAHHVVFWSRGGRSDTDNLLLLCGEHHRALHDGAFTSRPSAANGSGCARPTGRSSSTRRCSTVAAPTSTVRTDSSTARRSPPTGTGSRSSRTSWSRATSAPASLRATQRSSRWQPRCDRGDRCQRRSSSATHSTWWVMGNRAYARRSARA